MAEKKKKKNNGGMIGKAKTKMELNKERAAAIKKGDFKKVKEINKKLKGK